MFEHAVGEVVMPDGGLKSILARFPGKRILVVGDAMLDEYLWGAVRRISPEAPVPVVELEKRTYVAGGAANTAANVASLGATALLVGVVGGDEAGKHLRGALAAQGIGLERLLVAEDRPTTTKTRVIAHSQQVVRIDREDRCPFPPAQEEELLRLIDERLPGVDASVLSDYAKGLVSPALAQRLIRQGAKEGKPVVVDPKGVDPSKYRGATLVKPNLHEAGMLLRHEVSSLADVLDAGPRLLDLLGAGGALVTRGAAGMSLFQRGAEPIHIAAQAREVYDVTGAGDTVVAALAVALAAGASLEQAARLASRAAGIAVGRVGTATVRLDELLGRQGA